MHAAISGLGQWFPEKKRTNEDWPQEFVTRNQLRSGDRTLMEAAGANDAQADRCQDVVKRHLALEAGDPFLGSKERRVAAPNMTSAEAEAAAAERALRDANLKPSDVDVVLSWALVPDRIMPSNACRVCELVKLSSAWACTVDAACASPVSQLDIAAAMIESGRARTVLLTQSHLATRAFPMLHPSAPCMGDGATAIVLTQSKRPGILRSHIVTHGEYYSAVTWCRGRSDEQDSPWWESGGDFVMSSRDPVRTRQLIRDVVLFGARTITELAERASFNLTDLDLIAAVHPRSWIPGAIAEGLGLEPKIAPQTYEKYGHLGGVGAVVNLIAARDSGLLRPGARAVMYAQGAGFTRAAIALEWAPDALA